MTKPFYIAEVSSNHHGSLERCLEFVDASAACGCDAVKFQLFKVDQLFAPEILVKSADHRKRAAWELPLAFVPEIAKATHQAGMQFSCTPFYMDAVKELEPYIDFYKIASYELLWLDLIRACAETEKPLVLSTGMATLDEIHQAVDAFQGAGGSDLTLLHCVSGYPVAPEHCNLKAIETISQATGCKVGWSDHSRDPDVVRRAINRFGAVTIEFHLDLDEKGAEYQTGHCWLPEEIRPVIEESAETRIVSLADGNGIKAPTPAEIDDREWRADPSDGLRPLLHVRRTWQPA